MKNFLFLILIIPMFSIGQTDQSNKSDFIPEYYIDSVKVDIDKIFVNKSNVESIDISNRKNGKIYISLKENTTLKELIEINFNNIDPQSNNVYFIDNTLIKNPKEVKIDLQEISNVEIINSSEIENQSAEFNMIYISTHSKNEEDNSNKSYVIRKVEYKYQH